jgi:hypothetical protein
MARTPQVRLSVSPWSPHLSHEALELLKVDPKHHRLLRMATQPHPIRPIELTSGWLWTTPDSALIIDAMDLLHGGGLEGFCLVSSDSDFTRLASR